MNQGIAGDQHIRSGGSASLQLSVLAGLETGVIGGLSMLVFLCAHSALRGQVWWSYANLLGSIVYGPSALWRGFGRATLAGIAIQILVSSVAGVLYGVCFARTRGRMVSLLLGMSCGVIWFFISYQLLFRAVGPLIPVYASQPATLLGHAILGLVLSRTSMLYLEWPPGWRLWEGLDRRRIDSGIPDATQAGRNG